MVVIMYNSYSLLLVFLFLHVEIWIFQGKSSNRQSQWYGCYMGFSWNVLKCFKLVRYMLIYEKYVIHMKFIFTDYHWKFFQHRNSPAFGHWIISLDPKYIPQYTHTISISMRLLQLGYRPIHWVQYCSCTTFSWAYM